MPAKSPHLFISYRRDDSQWIARALHRHLSEGYGVNRVFMDRIEIRGGDRWRQKIEDGLQRSTVMLVIIGKEWLKLTNDLGRLRIDQDDDWVRKEIRFALDNGLRLIALYVDDATPIRNPQALPADIRGMLELAEIELSVKLWEAGLTDLFGQLRRHGFQPAHGAVPMPQRRKRVDPLTTSELEKALDTLPGWGITTTYETLTAGDAAVAKTELYKEYTFDSFVEATAFMAWASPGIDVGQHHPRWENVWKTVRVWLSTWDIEFQPSRFDTALAHTLDDLCKAFKAQRRAV